MKKYLVPLVILLVFVIILAGCSTNATTTPATTPPNTTQSTTPATSHPVTTTPSTTLPPTSTTPAASSKYGGTLRYIAAAGPGAPIGAPWLSNGTSTFNMQFAINYLLNGEADGTYVPSLATSYDIDTSADSPSVTLHLRQGVKFSDGSDFNAQAVLWNLQQQMSPQSTNLGTTTNWKSVEVLDDYTIRVNLKTWQNTAIGTFATSTAFIVSPTAYQKNGADWMNFHMVGTGPFIQTNYQSDVTLAFAKNPNYWQAGKPYLDGLSLLFVSDAMTAEALFKSGGGDVIQSYSDQMTSDLRQAGYTIIPSQVGGTSSIWPDSANADSPWSNLMVRQAAEYAIDKVGLSNTFGYGNWTPAYQGNASVSPAYDPNLTPRTYNVAKAKQMLSDAGYPNGFKTSIIVSPFGANHDIAVALQALWKAVGIQADLQFPQVGAFSGMLTGTWHNGVIFGPAPLGANPLGGWNLTFSPGSPWFGSMARPDGIYDLMAAALATPQLDPALVKKIEDLLYNNETIIPLWFAPTNWAVTDKVMDSGIGTRDMFAWFEPQNAWLQK
jgi:peptide/nickel transport system substrate-binding protein